MIGAGVPFGAEQRLLPEWIPLTFFAFAIICLPLGWLITAVQADNISGFSGGFGPVLGGLHMFTLGVLLSTAFGASMQMLPVATGATMNKPGRVVTLLGLLLIGVPVTLGGFSHYFSTFTSIGALFLCAAAFLYIFLLFRLLLRAENLKLVRHYVFLAAICLLIAASLGLFMILDWDNRIQFNMPDPGYFHAAFAVYGFMGLIVFGFSRIMVPMLSVSTKTNDKQAYTVLFMATGALILWGTGFDMAAALLGVAAACLHSAEMFTILKGRMRTRLDPEWLPIRFAWIMLPLSLVLFTFGIATENLANLIQVSLFIAILGWLVSFVIGILQRIIPFLLSMQIARRTGMPELPSKLCAENIIKYVGPLHMGAVILCAFGIATDQPLIIQIGSLPGIVSGGLFLSFFIIALKRKRLSLENQKV